MKRYHEKSPGVWIERYQPTAADTLLTVFPSDGVTPSPGRIIIGATRWEREIDSFDIGFIWLKVDARALSPVTHMEPPGGRYADMPEWDASQAIIEVPL